MGKRKMAREANRETEVKTKKMKSVNAETDITNDGDHLSRATYSRQLKCESNADTTVESLSKESKGKKSIKGNKALKQSAKKSEVIKENKSKKIIFGEPHEIKINISDVVSTRKKSRKRNKTALDSQVNNEITVNNCVEQRKAKKPKELNKVLKKTVFVDDEPQEVPSMSGTITKPANAKKKFLNDDEAEVKEEDIDKYCDELNEEDNAQYEEWVKLIEANFHSNKKKVK